MRPILIKYLKRIGYLFFLLIVSLLILEVCFRYQIIAFYQPELKALNTKEELSSTKNNIVVFGDSFTAHPDNYLSYLKRAHPDCNIVNSAISGTGIKQHELLFKERINKFNPKAIIYQFYVGNDFLDIKHPINYNELSFFRNVFWTVSEHLLVLQYLNYRLAFLNKNSQPISVLHESEFSVEKYNHRVKLYFRADAACLTKSVFLNNSNTKEVYRQWKDKFDLLNELTDGQVPIHLLLVPHNAQVSELYCERNVALGASLPSQVVNSTFPLFNQMKKDLKTIKVLNPLATFQELENSDSLYYQNDPHLTTFGQQALGAFLVKNISFENE